jgi:hypothetical protein
VSKKPTELPNIEDATLRACLAPLMDAMNSGGEMASQSVSSAAVARASPPARVPSGSNDNPLPVSETIGTVDRDPLSTPGTLAEWRLQADDDFGAFRMIALFLAMSDAELATVAAEFPKQIAGTVSRIARIKRRLAAQYDMVTAAMALLERATTQAVTEPDSD